MARWIITPGEMPRLRDYLLREVTATAEQRGLADDILRQISRRAGADHARRMRTNHIGNHDHRHLEKWLHIADLYLVNDAMTALCMQAGRALGETYRIDHTDPPAHVGVLIWGNYVQARILLSENSDPEELGIRGVVWAPTMTRLGPGLVLLPFTDTDALLRTNLVQRLVAQHKTRRETLPDWAWADNMPVAFGLVERSDSEVPRTLLATWTIMRQRLAVMARAVLPRSVRRQYERDGRVEPRVHTITLRRQYAAPDGHVAQATGREYRHQWVVEGHWHRYWTGPGRATERRLWVADYVKGPEGAPMIGGERVNVLRR